ncbi:MAG TPA: hypothetical protein VFZ36_06500 [Vicinamibacterales bacterium]
MTSEENVRDYLWDPASPAASEVEALEQRFEALRFDPAARPLDLSRLPAAVLPHRAAWRRPVIAMAIAASLLMAAGAGLWTWRWTWPEGRAWTVREGPVDARLEVGRAITIPDDGGAIANIARIGTMRLAGGTSLELRSTRDTRHRLRMTGGDIHVRVWAPPVSVVIETPAGEVIDMGCEFLLSVSGDRSAVRVLSGWVQLENGIDEVLVPAGASSEMTSRRGPGVAVFDDAAPGFAESVRALEADGDPAAVERILALARPRDVYTLLGLADRHRSAAEALLRRSAELWPPPDGVTIGRILRGDRESLWMWSRSLPLPPTKTGWWKNWRDAFPLGLSER